MASAVDSTIAAMKYTLNNGNKMPAVGLGTFRIREPDEMYRVVDEALKVGYRLFDTAAVYHNETLLRDALGNLLPKYDLDRDDIFITTKLCEYYGMSPAEHGGSATVSHAYRHSMHNLGLEFADLYLIHFPGTQRLPCNDTRNMDIRQLTWASMVELYDDGLVNAIGVSNFTVYHLSQLIKNNHGVIPAVNQVEWHPFYHQDDVLEFCKEHEITLQAYCPLGGTSADNDALLKHPAVMKIAQKLEVTSAQVCLAWAVQQEVSIIPKSTNPTHIKENITLNFTIPDEDMKVLNDLGSAKIKYAWDPSYVV